MKHFTIKLGHQSLSFSEADLPVLDAALQAAIRKPGQEAIHKGQSGQISVLMSSGEVRNGVAGNLHFIAADY